MTANADLSCEYTATLTFNMGGKDTQISAQTVEEGSKAEKPADPTAEGFEFDGWYIDTNFTTEFDFNTAISADTEVFAKWAEIEQKEEPAYPQKPANPDSPSTGDTSYIMLWAVVLLMSGSGVVFLTVKKKAK